MAEQNIRRLVCITGLGAGDSRGHGGFFFDRLFLPLMLRKVYEDKNRQEDAIRASTLDWTIVLPTVLNDNGVNGATSVVAGKRSHVQNALFKNVHSDRSVQSFCSSI
jgi:uncharacterized protein YbjT (DUF2867 family)